MMVLELFCFNPSICYSLNSISHQRQQGHDEINEVPEGEGMRTPPAAAVPNALPRTGQTEEGKCKVFGPFYNPHISMVECQVFKEENRNSNLAD